MKTNILNWREYPFVRLVLPLMFGIGASPYLQIPIYFLSIFSILLLLLILPMANWKSSYSFRFLFGSLVSIFLFFLGSYLNVVSDYRNHPDYFGQYIGEEVAYLGSVQDRKENEKYIRLVIKMEKVAGISENLIGKVLVYLPRDLQSQKLSYGDQIRFRGSIRSVERSKNPEAFDYAKYLGTQNIHHQAFLKTDQWQLIAKNNSRTILTMAKRWQNQCVHILSKYIPDAQAFGVVSALVLGQKDFLDRETKTAYSRTGAMHVLAVSGLHIGLVAGFVLWILNWIPWYSSAWRWTKTGMAILSIWCFAGLTGAAPSVLRAATMFSFLLIGRARKDHANIYNILAASAFFLLCFQPQMLWSIGFQLSYLAVIGIIYFQPKIYRICYIPNQILNSIWQLTSVSLAAQCTTLPINLYYFGQLPLLFVLSGLVVIPAASLILGVGLLIIMLNICLGDIWLVGCLGKCLSWVVYWVNTIIFWIGDIPMSVISPIYISVWLMLLAYIGISCIVLALNTRDFKWIRRAGILILFMSIDITASEISRYDGSQLVVYSHRKGLLIDFYDRGYWWSIQQDLDSKEVAFLADNFRGKHGGYTVNVLDDDATHKGDSFVYADGLLTFKNKKILVVEYGKLPDLASSIYLDYIILSRSNEVNLVSVIQKYNFNRLVFCANNYTNKIDEWKRIADLYQLPYYDIKQSGALFIQ